MVCYPHFFPYRYSDLVGKLGITSRSLCPKGFTSQPRKWYAVVAKYIRDIPIPANQLAVLRCGMAQLLRDVKQTSISLQSTRPQFPVYRCKLSQHYDPLDQCEPAPLRVQENRWNKIVNRKGLHQCNHIGTLRPAPLLAYSCTNLAYPKNSGLLLPFTQPRSMFQFATLKSQ